MPFIKIINANIKVDADGQIDKNLWVDIFPIDNAPLNKKHYKRINFWYRLYFLKRNQIRKIPFKGSFFKKIAKKILAHCLNYKFVIKHLIDSSTKFNNNSIVNDLIWGIGKKEEFPKKLFDELVIYDFENIKVKGFKNADLWLRNRYGNYMQLPPKEQQQINVFKSWKIKN